MIEKQEEISLGEFKAWLAGLIRGKRGALPDLEDWKAIKETLDKVTPDTVDVPTWTPPTIVREVIREPSAPLPDPVPYVNPYQPIWVTPNTWQPSIGDVWCGDDLNRGGAGDNLYGGGNAGGYAYGGSAGVSNVGGTSAGAGGSIGGMIGAGGCSTIKIDNTAMSPTSVEDGDIKVSSNGFMTLNPEQLQFSFTTTSNDSEKAEEPLDNAMAMLFATQTKELT